MTQLDEGVPPPDAGWRGRLRRLTVDVRPLRVSRQFRLLYIGGGVSFLGGEITAVAIPFQVYALTDSTAALGAIGACYLVPLVTLPIVGGAIADAVDRRWMLLLTEAAAAVFTLLLAWNATRARPSLLLLYVMAVALAAMYALSLPAARSTAPLLLEDELLPAAAALGSISHNFGALVGPAIAGVVIAAAGVEVAYFVDAGTYAASMLALSLMAPLPPHADAERVTVRGVLDGFRFLKGRRVLQGSFLIDINAMVLGFPNVLFPAIARGFGGPQVLGLLYAAPPLGAFLAAATSGWTSRIRRHGRAVSFAVVVWGLSLVMLGFAPALWIALLALAMGGAADMVSGIFRTAILQRETPKNMVGRLHGVELVVVAGGPAVGDLEAGLLAALTSVPFSIAFGGLGCIVGVGLIAVLMPEFNRYVAAPAEATRN